MPYRSPDIAYTLPDDPLHLNPASYLLDEYPPLRPIPVRFYTLSITSLQSLVMYRDYGTPTGGFLHAVLMNNLINAAMSADSRNQHALLQYADFMHNEMPTAAFGTEEKIAAWIEAGGAKGHQTAQNEIEAENDSLYIGVDDDLDR